MTVKELVSYLENPHLPMDAEVLVHDDSVSPNVTVKPQVVWWSSDRTTVYLGVL